MPTELRGLYVVTDRFLIPPGALLERVSAAIEGGARLVQYRDKGRDDSRRQQEAQALQALCSKHGVPLIINDDVALAARIGAAGVHIGREDPDVDTARRRLGAHAVIGVSCYDSISLAVAAETAGADYAAFGSVFPSPTKPDAKSASLQLLGKAHERLAIPVCAIGGITADNAARVIAAGADMVAVVSGVFGKEDVRAASRSIARLFESASETTS